MFATSSEPREIRLEATIMRTVAPDATDLRPWQQQQCPHCQGLFWTWAKGVISYWHRNPVRRLAYWINSLKGE